MKKSRKINWSFCAYSLISKKTGSARLAHIQRIYFQRHGISQYHCYRYGKRFTSHTGRRDSRQDKTNRHKLLYSRPNRIQEAAQEHEAIVDALQRGDEDKALLAMKEHLHLCYTSAYSYIVSETAETAPIECDSDI